MLSMVYGAVVKDAEKMTKEVENKWLASSRR